MQNLPIGHIIAGRYVLDEIIGSGGFGVVYRASDLDSRTVVAIKIAHSNPDAGSDWLRRQEREVRALRQLKSPQTIRLWDDGTTEDGRLFLVFEYLGGKDLSELLRDGAPWPADRVREVLIQVLGALDEAHGAGLLHRDLKPDNIRVLNPGGQPVEVKLLDFGVARDPNLAADKITATGVLIGTPRYMSPEQLSGRPLSPASDLYSLGVVAFEMLMGPAAMHGWQLSAQIERLAKSTALALPGVIDPQLREVVDKMVRRDPQQRYQSAAQVLRALSPPVVEPQPAPIATRRLPIALVGVVALLIFIAFAAAWTARQPQEPVSRTVRQPSNPGALLKTQPAAKPPPTPPPNDAGSALDATNLDATIRTGCGKAIDFVGGKRRFPTPSGERVALYVPGSYSSERAHPVVVMFHDLNQTPGKHVDESQMTAVANDGGFVIVAPQSADLPFPWTRDPVRDTREALDVAAETLCIDRDRIFAVGLGFGAKFAARLPCSMPEIGGIATVAYRSRPTLDCAPNPPIPVLHVAAREHRYLPLDGGQAPCFGEVEISLEEQDNLWIAHNGCRGDRQVLEKNKHGTCWTWDCEVGFASCLLEGGRGWVGTEDRELLDIMNCDGPPPKFDTAQTIWRFFREHSARRADE